MKKKTAMKSQCDGCRAKVASVFCCTEGTALCNGCDAKRHGGASDHHQCFKIHYPVANQFPTCEICQETKAFIFCLEHRAITCRICDNTYHSNNKWTMTHNRFLLTGATLSSDDNGGGDGEYYSPKAPTPSINMMNTTTSIGTCSSTTHRDQGGAATVIDMSSSDDPYGLLYKKNRNGYGSSFEDTDLGCYLSSLSSPKTS